jgi:hypothetical protein
MIIVIGVKSPMSQIIPIIIINVVLAVYLVIVRPYESCVDNILAITNNICYVIILIVFMILEKNRV